MKKLTRAQRSMITLFFLVIAASFIGNALGYWAFHRNANTNATLEKLTAIEKLQRDTQYHNKTIEQANKENLKLQQALEFHQQLMNKTNRADTPAAKPIQPQH